MRPLAVIFSQPAFEDFPYFIQCPEQVKIQDFCPVRPVQSFDKRILCCLTWFDKFQRHTMALQPIEQSSETQVPDHYVVAQ
ncbi:hypothetical protein BES32_23520 [Serratia marcescens]|nr:hypothetical protein BES32_23520 [Serratia marcescens]